MKAAELAVKFRPLWWEGWQTLGRAQLNLGEVDLVSMTGSANAKRKQISAARSQKSRQTAIEFGDAIKCTYKKRGVCESYKKET